MIDTTEIGLSMFAGPEVLKQPFSSIALQDIVEYEPTQIAKALLKYPYCKLINDCKPTS